MSEACRVPLIDLLGGVPPDARILIVEDGGMSSHSIPVGRYSAEAAAELRRLQRELDLADSMYKLVVLERDQAYREVEALRKQLAEHPAPAVLTDADLRNIARSLPPADCDRVTVHWRSVNMFARAILAAIPPGHVVVKDEPVAEVDADGVMQFKWVERRYQVGDKLYLAARPGGQG